MRKLASICAVTALGLAGAAWAQSESSQYPSTSTPDASPSPSGTTEPSGSMDSTRSSDSSGMSSSTRTASAATASMTGDHRGSKIIGMSVQSAAGESLGTVKDIIVDQQGKLTHVIVSYGGTLGLGNKLAAVPWEQASHMMSGSHLVLQKEKLQSAPSFTESEWPNLASSSWSTTADQYWQQGSMRTKSAEAPSTDSNSSSSSTGEMKDRG